MYATTDQQAVNRALNDKMVAHQRSQGDGRQFGSIGMAREAACQITQPARPKEVPEKLDQLRNCVDQLEQTAARLVDGMETGGVMAPQQPEPMPTTLAGGLVGQVTSMGGDLEQLRARVMQVTNRLQSAHSRLEV